MICKNKTSWHQPLQKYRSLTNHKLSQVRSVMHVSPIPEHVSKNAMEFQCWESVWQSLSCVLKWGVKKWEDKKEDKWGEKTWDEKKEDKWDEKKWDAQELLYARS